jgi:hypothetical protein
VSSLLSEGGGHLLSVRDAVAPLPPSEVDLRPWWPEMGRSRSSQGRSSTSPAEWRCVTGVGAIVVWRAWGGTRLDGGVGLPSARWPPRWGKLRV